jgi:hypothetical protein
MGWNLGVGMQGKTVHTGTARPLEFRTFPFRAKARANPSHLLSRPFPKGNALLDGGGHGASEFGVVVEQWIISSGHGGLHSRLSISQPTQLADHPTADFPDDVGHVGITGWLGFDKAGLEAGFGAIEVDTLKEDDMKMEMQID